LSPGAVYGHAAGFRPGRRVPFGGRQKEPKTSLNVHQCLRAQRHLARCVHPLAALSRHAAPSVHARRDESARSTLDDRVRVRRAATGRAFAVGWPLRAEPRPVRAPCGTGLGASAALRLFRVLRDPGPDARARMGQGYGSVPPAGEHTVPNAFACPGIHERWEDVFDSFWRPPKGIRLPGRDPAAWQSTALTQQSRQRARQPHARSARPR